MRIKILDISTEDAYYEDRSYFIGQTGEVSRLHSWENGWVAGHVKFDHEIYIPKEIERTNFSFYKIMFDVIN